MLYSFPKHNRLCGQNRIAQLYRDGKRVVVWPLRVTYMPLPEELASSHNEVLVWAPKSLFKRAVKRNRLRRLIREAYRLNQGILQAEPGMQQGYMIAFNYMDKEEQAYRTIEKAVSKALKRIKDEGMKG